MKQKTSQKSGPFLWLLNFLTSFQRLIFNSNESFFFFLLFALITYVTRAIAYIGYFHIMIIKDT